MKFDRTHRTQRVLVIEAWRLLKRRFLKHAFDGEARGPYAGVRSGLAVSAREPARRKPQPVGNFIRGETGALAKVFERADRQGALNPN
jgi:hypothetical protein